MARFQPAKRLGGAVAIVVGVWLGVGVAPAASIDFLAHQADLPTMPWCGTGREWQNAASGLLDRVARANPKPILARLRSPDPEVRASCALVAAWNDTPGSLEPILALTRDPNPRVRRCALRAVTYYRDPRIVPLLLRALHDPDQRCQLMACGGLKNMDDPAGRAAAKAWYAHWVNRSR